MAKTDEKIVLIPISEIELDWKWNSRSKGALDYAGGPEDESTGFQGIVESIRASMAHAEAPAHTGQHEAVTVRPQPNADKKTKYSMVKGFQRTEAISRIDEANKLAPELSCVRAIVKAMTEEDAVMLNAAENLCRNSLTPPDTMFAVTRMAETGMTDTAIAAKVGLGQSYVSKLHRISEVDKKVLKHWRTSSDPLPVNRMLEVVAVAPELQHEKYLSMLPKAGEEGEGEGNEKKPWVYGAMKKAEKIGDLLGTLSAMGCVAIDPDVDWESVARAGVKIKDTATVKQRGRIAAAARMSFIAAVAKAEDEAAAIPDAGANGAGEESVSP